MQLLISVVEPDEVDAAVAGGADIVDVKNPREGSLGAGFPHVIRAVRACVPPELPVSAAIGDVPDLPGMVSLAAAGAAGCGVQYVKVGLLGPPGPAEARVLLGEVVRAVRDTAPSARVMATGYADARRIGAVLPADLPAVAAEAGADGCMLDTADKSSGTLLAVLPHAELKVFVADCRRHGLACALAGSLREGDVSSILALGPDIVGFRGAACRGDRVRGHVDTDAVRRLKRLIAQG